MKIIIDTNRIIAALVKNGVSRQILLLGDFNFFSPEFTLAEIEKYKREIVAKAAITEAEFSTLLRKILVRIKIFEKSEYSSKMQEALELMSSIDIKDVPFVAVALFIENDGIWSDDPHFKRQAKIKVWTTKELIEEVN